MACEDNAALLQDSREKKSAFSNPSPVRFKRISPGDQGSRGFLISGDQTDKEELEDQSGRVYGDVLSHDSGHLGIEAFMLRKGNPLRIRLYERPPEPKARRGCSE